MPSKARTKTEVIEADEQAPWETGDQVPDVTPAEQQQIEPAEPAVTGVIDDPMQSLMDWCLGYVEATAADNAAVMAAEVRRILAGEDAETVLAESTPLKGEDHLEKPFLLHGFSLIETDFTDGWPFYAAMRCSAADIANEFVLTSGGVKVIAALCSLHTIGEYPYPVKLRGATTKKGNTVYSLVMAGSEPRK